MHRSQSTSFLKPLVPERLASEQLVPLKHTINELLPHSLKFLGTSVGDERGPNLLIAILGLWILLMILSKIDLCDLLIRISSDDNNYLLSSCYL